MKAHPLKFMHQEEYARGCSPGACATRASRTGRWCSTRSSRRSSRHIHAFESFGGVSEKVTPDNLKAAIIVARSPLVNGSYRKLAELYGFLIVCRGGPNTRVVLKTTSSTSRETFCRCSARSTNSAMDDSDWITGDVPWPHDRGGQAHRQGIQSEWMRDVDAGWRTINISRRVRYRTKLLSICVFSMVTEGSLAEDLLDAMRLTCQSDQVRAFTLAIGEALRKLVIFRDSDGWRV